MPVQRRRRLRFMPLNSLIPNILTMLALCAGLTSVRFALDEKWEMSVIAILAAGVLDGLDGRMARLLNSASKFGAELDSLSDFVSFGVAPGLVLFLWTLESGLGGVGWIISLIFTVSCGLRLARFNSMLEEKQPAWASRYFTGIAAPAGASISLLFMVISFYTGDDFFRSPILNAAWMLFMAFMMASRIPTFSIKRIRIARRFIMLILLLVGGLAAVLASLFLGERLDLRGKFGLVLGFSGIVVIVLPQLSTVNGDSYLAGVGYILLAAFGISVSNVLIRRVAPQVDALMAMGSQLLIGGVPLAVGALVLEDPRTVVWNYEFVLILASLALFGSSLAYWLWSDILKKTELNRANVFSFLVPVFGLSLGALFFNERIGGFEVTGIVLSLVGIALASRSGDRKKGPSLRLALPASARIETPQDTHSH